MKSNFYTIGNLRTNIYAAVSLGNRVLPQAFIHEPPANWREKKVESFGHAKNWRFLYCDGNTGSMTWVT